MRVVSMVPSWTETLIRSGIDVVGRTRYCIHPAPQVVRIPIVGGTKDVDWNLVMDLKPDLVLFDKEENPLEMAEECPLPFLTTHVFSLSQLQKELERLGDFFKNSRLIELAVDCYDLLQASKLSWNFEKIPGLLELIKTTDLVASADLSKGQKTPQIAYIIWKKPWMTVTRETYIGSVLEYLGAVILTAEGGEKYPVIELEDYKNSFFLFSSEPFPFHKKTKELRDLGIFGAVVNGESYSWFGLRSLDFLKSLAATANATGNATCN